MKEQQPRVEVGVDGFTWTTFGRRRGMRTPWLGLFAILWFALVPFGLVFFLSYGAPYSEDMLVRQAVVLFGLLGWVGAWPLVDRLWARMRTVRLKADAIDLTIGRTVIAWEEVESVSVPDGRLIVWLRNGSKRTFRLGAIHSRAAGELRERLLRLVRRYDHDGEVAPELKHLVTST